MGIKTLFFLEKQDTPFQKGVSSIKYSRKVKMDPEQRLKRYFFYTGIMMPDNYVKPVKHRLDKSMYNPIRLDRTVDNWIYIPRSKI
jgi:hypothetical protein